MLDKVYCIIRTENHVYIPVKAEKNPHNSSRDAYLKNLPNFFGGTVNKIEYIRRTRVITERTPAKALSDELHEESRNKIEISEDNIAAQMTDGNELLKAQVEEKQYWFGMIRIEERQLSSFATGNVLNFAIPSGDPDQNEMRYLLKVPIADVIKDIEERANIDAFLTLSIDQIDADVINRFADKILSACSTILTGSNRNYFAHILDQNVDLKRQWDESETKLAFAKLAAVLYG